MGTGEPSAPVLRLVRVFDAPRELVYRCMIDPDHLTHFWGPRGTSTPRERIRVDARVGGTFSAVMVSDADGSSYPFLVEFVELDEPERIVWRDPANGVVTTSTFERVDDRRTRVEIVQSNIPDSFLEHYDEAGFASSLDRLDDHLARIAGEEPASRED